jgi:hypothetical protein
VVRSAICARFMVPIAYLKACAAAFPPRSRLLECLTLADLSRMMMPPHGSAVYGAIGLQRLKNLSPEVNSGTVEFENSDVPLNELPAAFSADSVCLRGPDHCHVNHPARQTKLCVAT